MADYPVYDKKDQLERVQKYCLPNETLYAVYDMKGGGTGFLGITDLRLVFFDQSFLRKSKSMVSLPYNKISVVASEDSGALLFGTSKLQIAAGSDVWEFEFRSNDKAHHAYQLIMHHLLIKENQVA